MTKQCRAIIVEDEDWIREGLAENVDWGRLGIVLAGTFHDGREALEYMQTEHIGVILSDIRMPNLSGIEMLSTMKERERVNADHDADCANAKVVLLSGYSDFKYAQDALRLGAVDYLLKPAEVEDIEKALEKAKIAWERDMEIQRQLAGPKETPSERIQPTPNTLLMETEGTDSTQDTGTADGNISYLIKRAMGVIRDKYMEENLQLALIADELFVTPNYLSRLFRQETGLSFSDHVSQMRLEKACEFLVSGTQKIYQIGDAVGYPNPRYFSEWFQKQTGLSPADYRNRHAK